MNENFKFSGTRSAIEQAKLSEKELRIINGAGLTPEDLEKLLRKPPYAEGSYALIFEVNESDHKNIAKVWKNPQNDAIRARHENAALRLLRKHKSKQVPRNLGYLHSEIILFEEKIKGKHIVDFDELAICQLAETLAKIHNIKLSSYGKLIEPRLKGTQKDYLMAEISKLRESLSTSSGKPELLKLIEQAIDKFENAATSSPEAFKKRVFTLIHFDLNRNNILKSNDNNKIIIIDWEQAAAGDNAMDIAKMFLKLNFTEKQKMQFIEEYGKWFDKNDNSFQARLGVYEPFVLINSILWRLRVLKNTPKETSSANEKEFYARVKSNLDLELIKLKKYLS
ncbi:MAG TPA: aminoglycoside phosphotransferase family protein [Candidatus Bipolaricaulota bacterium]|nr:aminoglycoside phosphotransferase family protein [Candidatus Bipolaricaulota bacterium]